MVKKVKKKKSKQDKKRISTKRKIGKTTYEVVVHFNENATETMQDSKKHTYILYRIYKIGILIW